MEFFSKLEDAASDAGTLLKNGASDVVQGIEKVTGLGHAAKEVSEGAGLLKFGKEMEEIIKALEYIMAQCFEEFTDALLDKNKITTNSKPGVATKTPEHHATEELSMKR